MVCVHFLLLYWLLFHIFDRFLLYVDIFKSVQVPLVQCCCLRCRDPFWSQRTHTCIPWCRWTSAVQRLILHAAFTSVPRFLKESHLSVLGRANDVIDLGLGKEASSPLVTEIPLSHLTHSAKPMVFLSGDPDVGPARCNYWMVTRVWTCGKAGGGRACGVGRPCASSHSLCLAESH